MKKLAVFAVLLGASALAAAPKACEELKGEIAKKVEANGVKSYSLEIVDSGKEADAKVVGSCEGGTKKIVYRRTSAPAKSETAGSSKQ
jgi:hypothetical protein